MGKHILSSANARERSIRSDLTQDQQTQSPGKVVREWEEGVYSQKFSENSQAVAISW